MKRVTLEDIGKKLNVSKNTVSKALRGLPGVSEETRKKIIDLAREMGYTKIKTSYSVDAKPINISLICRKSFFDEPTFWSHVFYGIWNFAGKNNVSIRTVTVEPATENSASTLSSILNTDSQGYLIVGTISEEVLRKIVATKAPVVVVDYYNKDIECDYINSANDSGIYKAVKYLYDKNHRKIGFINNAEGAYTFNERYRAFVKYMEFFGLTINNRFIWHDAIYDDTGYYIEKINKLRKLPDFPTAWICVNDNTALAFYKALQKLDIKVPEEISIIGFDNISVSNVYDPFLTTIEVPQMAMGQWAMQQLLYRIEHPHEPFVNIELNTRLIERNSVRSLSD